MSHFVHDSEQTSPDLLRQFLANSGINAQQEPHEILRRTATAFSQLPYENLTKIIRAAETGNTAEARRLPGEVLRDHWAWGTGGTCFSLTWTLLQLVQALGWDAEPILADRSYGADTHCALLIWIDGVKHLLDPGYLLVEPLPMSRQGKIVVATSFNQAVLQPTNEGERVDLTTIDQSKAVHRLSYKMVPVDTGQFLRAWDASFDWEMMTYPVLSKVVEGQQFYLQKHHLVVRGLDHAHRTELSDNELATSIVQQFGIKREIVERALQVLQRKWRR